MSCQERLFNWRWILTNKRPTVPRVDACRRMRYLLAGFVFLLSMVMTRAILLEVVEADQFRKAAVERLTRYVEVPPPRGRILAGDGTVLAADQEVLVLALHYRYLEQPTSPTWLRQMAQRRLIRKDQSDSASLAEAISVLRVELAELRRRVGEQARLSPRDWNDRAAMVQARVERIHRSVNIRYAARRVAGRVDPHGAEAQQRSVIDTVLGWFTESPATRPTLRTRTIVVAEETNLHVLVEDLDLEQQAAINAIVDGLPKDLRQGVQVLTRKARRYPRGCLAGHVLGHLGPVTQQERNVDRSRKISPDSLDAGGDRYRTDDLIGRTGVEGSCESILRGRYGMTLRRTDGRGSLLKDFVIREPMAGADIVLTLDIDLQQSSETLLSGAIQRGRSARREPNKVGGAIVVMNCNSGAILAAASVPQLDPNIFLLSDRSAVRDYLFSDQGKPLLNRVTQMAIPPGSLMKIISSVALMEERTVSPKTSFFCQGYLTHPDRSRCLIYQRHGIGHENITLCDAVAQSCNVFFFQHCGRLGPDPLIRWIQCFGLGKRTGVDLPYEVPGRVPTPETISHLEGHRWRVGDTRAISVGQGSLTATPLQMVRVIAAIANGGRLVTPHVVQLKEVVPRAISAGNIADRCYPSAVITGLSFDALQPVREGMEQAVDHVAGTAHRYLSGMGISVAAKTGTAETYGGRAPHVWMGGYAPRKAPRVAFVVVLEHGGSEMSGMSNSGAVAQRLLWWIDKRGYLSERMRITHGDRLNVSTLPDKERS